MVLLLSPIMPVSFYGLGPKRMMICYRHPSQLNSPVPCSYLICLKVAGAENKDLDLCDINLKITSLSEAGWVDDLNIWICVILILKITKDAAWLNYFGFNVILIN